MGDLGFEMILDELGFVYYCFDGIEGIGMMSDGLVLLDLKNVSGIFFLGFCLGNCGMICFDVICCRCCRKDIWVVGFIEGIWLFMNGFSRGGGEEIGGSCWMDCKVLGFKKVLGLGCFG